MKAQQIIFLLRELIRNVCPANIPCSEHELSVVGCMQHLEALIGIWLADKKDTCVVIPCDSLEVWIVAARLSSLINILCSKQQFEEIQKITTDVELRNEYYLKYNL